MYNKMRYVSSKVEEFAKRYKKHKDDIHWAKVELYRGQCNCGYWHGVFGGLYMYHLRSAIYNHLIAAENIMDKVKHKELIIPGYAAAIAGDVEEELSGWTITVGPREAAHIPAFLKSK